MSLWIFNIFTVADIIPQDEINRTYILKSEAILVKFGLLSKPVGTSWFSIIPKNSLNKKTPRGLYFMIKISLNIYLILCRSRKYLKNSLKKNSVFLGGYATYRGIPYVRPLIQILLEKYNF